MLASSPWEVRRAVNEELGRRSLAEFIRLGWHVLEPTTPLVWNWHIGAVADHIQATLEDWMTRQDNPDSPARIQNLLINIPPGTAKSRIVSVFTPAWMWLRWPSWRCICLSSNPRVALRDSVYCRDLIESRWYRGTFRPSWTLAPDQNAKGLYRNTVGGCRQAMGFGSRITGDRADCLIVDDPHDAEEVNSDVARLSVLERWDAAIANRVNDLRTSVRIGVMQRLHEADWSGHILDRGGWEHVCLPQEYEPDRAVETAIGWSDPRTEPGELLFPARFPPDVLKDEKAKGIYFYAGQHQQRPAPAGGGMFPRDAFAVVEAAPTDAERLRYWDKAGTEGGTGAQSAGVKMARDRDGVFYVEHVIAGRWSALERERVIRQTAETDGREVAVWTEQEPGSGGKESAEATVRNLAGFDAHAERVTGDKVSRARPFAAQCEARNVRLVRGEWNAVYLDQLAIFPNGRLKDMVDASSGAFNRLADDPPTLQAIPNPLRNFRGRR